MTGSSGTGSSGGAEITVIGDYPSPWSNDASEIKALNRGEWSPITKTFEWLAANSRQTAPLITDSIEALLEVIIRRPRASIGRINIISHGNASGIGFSGSVEAHGNVFFDTANIVKIETLWDISKTKSRDQFGNVVEKFLIDSRGNKFTFHDVLNRFSEEARIVIYACKAGVSSDFAKHFAHIFGVEVHCFSSKLDYSVEHSGGKLLPRSLKVARHVGSGNTAQSGGVTDFNLLKPNIVGSPSDIVLPPDFKR